MARKKRENEWRNLSVQLDARLYDALKEEAIDNRRSMVATLEIILKDYFSGKKGALRPAD